MSEGDRLDPERFREQRAAPRGAAQASAREGVGGVQAFVALGSNLGERESHLAGSIAYIKSKQAEIFALVDEITGFNRTSRQSVTRYLNDFFEEISKEKSIEKKFIKRCS